MKWKPSIWKAAAAGLYKSNPSTSGRCLTDLSKQTSVCPTDYSETSTNHKAPTSSLLFLPYAEKFQK